MQELATDPWAMEPTALDALVARVADLARGPRLAGPTVTNPGPTVDRGVAFVDLRGTMVRKAPEWGAGETFAVTGDVQKAIEKAAADPAVRAIVLRIDSPGGQVSGTAELGEAIRAADALKPVRAVVEDMAASAAYWAASQARSISAPKSGLVGSIGTYAVVPDFSRMVEAAGIKVNVFRSGPLKGAGTFGAPLTDDQARHFQQRVEASARDFVAAVAAGRRLPTEKALGLATGAVWRGKDAQAEGLIDAIESAEAASARFTREAEEAAVLEQKTIDEARAAGVTQARTELRAFVSGFPAERLSYAVTAWLDGKTAVEAKAGLADVALAELAAERAKAADQAKADAERAEKLETLKAKARDPGVGFDGQARQEADQPQDLAKLPLEERCKREWDQDEALRAEFFDRFGAYVAFKRDEAAEAGE
jgi:signal peptide peptidase SppA